MPTKTTARLACVAGAGVSGAHARKKMREARKSERAPVWHAYKSNFYPQLKLCYNAAWHLS